MAYISKEMKVELLVFRLKNIFKHDKDEVWSRQDLFAHFLYNKDSHILEALEKLLEAGCISKYTHSRTFYYKYEHIRTIKINNYHELFRSIDRNMTFGIEFEFGSKLDTDDFISMLIETEFDTFTKKINSNPYSKWEVITDASISVDGYGDNIEIISPILRGSEGLKELKRMTDLLNTLKKMGFIKQNNTCGTHVHHSAKGYTPVTKLIYTAEAAQPFMNQFVNKKRAMTDKQIIDYWEETFYCAPVKKDKYFDGNTVSYDEKYINLSITNYNRVGTVEFRQLHGTINFRKIASWIIMGQKIIKKSKYYSKSLKIDTEKKFYTYFGIRNESIRKALVA